MILKLGMKLFFICLAYIFIAFSYFNSLWKYPLAMKLDVFWGVIFVVLWFYYGFRTKAGFINGLAIGLIGAAGGILLALLSLLFSINSQDGAHFFIMVPWSYPFIGLLEIVPYYGIINNYFPHISVIIVVLVTAIGSWLGKLLE